MDVTSRICGALGCDTSDIMEYVENENRSTTGVEKKDE